jgi:hypothetical protein
MNAYFSVSTRLSTEAKFKELSKRLAGPANAIWALYRLWRFTALFRPDGDLTGVEPFEMGLLETEYRALFEARVGVQDRPLLADPSGRGRPDEQAKSANVGQTGSPNSAKGFIRIDENGRVVVNDWDVHNEWAARAKKRVESSLKAASVSAENRRRRRVLDTRNQDLVGPKSEGSTKASAWAPSLRYDTNSVGLIGQSDPSSSSGSSGEGERVSDPGGSDAETLVLASPPNGKTKPVRKSPLIDAELQKWLDSTFEWFYRLYPRHEKRIAARNAWGKLHADLSKGAGRGLTKEVREAMAQDIYRRIKNGEWRPEDAERRQYIPLPASYLSQRRWEDGEEE